MPIYTPNYTREFDDAVSWWFHMLHRDDITFGYAYDLRLVVDLQNIHAIYEAYEGRARPAWYPEFQTADDFGTIAWGGFTLNYNWWRLDSAGAWARWTVPDGLAGIDSFILAYYANGSGNGFEVVRNLGQPGESVIYTGAADGSAVLDTRVEFSTSPLAVGETIAIRQTGGTPRMHGFMAFNSAGSISDIDQPYHVSDRQVISAAGSSHEYAHGLNPGAGSRWTGGYAHQKEPSNCTETNVAESWRLDGAPWTPAAGWVNGELRLNRTADVDYNAPPNVIAGTDYTYTFGKQLFEFAHTLEATAALTVVTNYPAMYPCDPNWPSHAVTNTGEQLDLVQTGDPVEVDDPIGVNRLTISTTPAGQHIQFDLQSNSKPIDQVFFSRLVDNRKGYYRQEQEIVSIGEQWHGGWSIAYTDGSPAPEQQLIVRGRLRPVDVGNKCWVEDPRSGQNWVWKGDGAGHYIEMLANPLRQFKERTMWIKVRTSTSGLEYFYTSSSSNDPQSLIALGQDASGNARLQAISYNNRSNTVVGPAINDGAWHQLIGILNRNGHVWLYVDGQLAGSDDSDNLPETEFDLFSIGALVHQGADDYSNASLCQAGVVNRISDSQELARIAAGSYPADGLAFPIDEGPALLTPAVGIPASWWVDRSAQRNHAYGEGDQRPIIGVDGVGNHYLRADGSDDWMGTIKTMVARTGGELSVFIVYESRSASANLIEESPNVGGGPEGFLVSTGANVTRIQGSTGYWSGGTPAAPTGVKSIRELHSSDGEQIMIDDGAQVGTPGAVAIGNMGGDIGYLFSRDGSANFLDGDVYRIYAYPRRLTAEQADAVREWIRGAENLRTGNDYQANANVYASAAKNIPNPTGDKRYWQVAEPIQPLISDFAIRWSFKPASGNVFRYVFSTGGLNASQPGFSWGWSGSSSNNITMLLTADGVYKSSVSVSTSGHIITNAWNDCALFANRKTSLFEMWVNGVAVGNMDWNTRNLNPWEAIFWHRRAVIGSRHDGTDGFFGEVADFAYWECTQIDQAIPAADRQLLTGSRIGYSELPARLKNDLVHWWPMSDPPGTVIRDVHGNNHGTERTAASVDTVDGDPAVKQTATPGQTLSLWESDQAIRPLSATAGSAPLLKSQELFGKNTLGFTGAENAQKTVSNVPASVNATVKVDRSSWPGTGGPWSILSYSDSGATNRYWDLRITNTGTIQIESNNSGVVNTLTGQTVQPTLGSVRVVYSAGKIWINGQQETTTGTDPGTPADISGINTCTVGALQTSGGLSQQLDLADVAAFGEELAAWDDAEAIAIDRSQDALYGSPYRSSDYADLAAAVAAIGSANATLYVDDAQTLAADQTCPANIFLEILSGGSIVLGDFNLTVQGSIRSDSDGVITQAGSGVPTFAAAHEDQIRCNWWADASNEYGIQKAIDCADRSSVKTVLLQGDYTGLNPQTGSTPVIYMRNDVELIGEGRGLTSLVLDRDAPLGPLMVYIEGTPISGCKVKRMTIDANQCWQSQGVYVAQPNEPGDGASNLEFDRLEVKNTGKTCVFLQGDNSVVANCYIHHASYTDSGHCMVVANGMNMTVRSCLIEEAGQGFIAYAVDLAGGREGWTIDAEFVQCSLRNGKNGSPGAKYGVAASVNGEPTRIQSSWIDCYIMNNEGHGLTQTGPGVENEFAYSFKDCVIHGNGNVGLALRGDATGEILVDGCTITDNAGHGLTTTKGTIRGCLISGSGLDGVHVHAVTGNTILVEDCQIIGNSASVRQGIMLNRSDTNRGEFTLQDCTVKNNNNGAFKAFDGWNFRIDGCEFLDDDVGTQITAIMIYAEGGVNGQTYGLVSKTNFTDLSSFALYANPTQDTLIEYYSSSVTFTNVGAPTGGNVVDLGLDPIPG